MSWKVLRFIRSGIDIFAVLALLGFLLPWFLLAGDLSDYPIGVPLFIRLAFLIFWGRYLTRFFQRSPLFSTEKNQKIGSISFILISMGILIFLIYYPFLGGPPEDTFSWFFLSIIALLWGMKSGTDEVTGKTLHRVLTGGAFSFALFFYIAYRMGIWEQFQDQAVPFTMVWFLLIIVTLGLFRVLEYSRYSSERAEKISRFWSPFIGILAITCVFLAVIVSFVIPGIVNILRVPFRAILAVGQFILTGVLWVVSYIAAGVIYLLNRLITPVEWEMEMEQNGQLGLQEELSELAEQTEPISQTAVEYTAVLITLVIFGVIAFIIMTLIRKGRGKEEEQEETRESLVSPATLSRWASESWQGFKTNWSDRLNRLKRSRGYRSATEIYNAVLEALGGRGYPRPREMTPHRFQPRIKKLLPESGEKLDRILETFSGEYYAGRKIEQEEIQGLLEDMREILRSIGKLEKKKKE